MINLLSSKKGHGTEAKKRSREDGSSFSKCVLSFVLYALKTKRRDAFSFLPVAINAQTGSGKRFQL